MLGSSVNKGVLPPALLCALKTPIFEGVDGKYVSHSIQKPDFFVKALLDFRSPRSTCVLMYNIIT